MAGAPSVSVWTWYGLLLGCALFFFLLGLLVGREFSRAVPEGTAPAEPLQVLPGPAREDLRLYEDLIRPHREAPEGESVDGGHFPVELSQRASEGPEEAPAGVASGRGAYTIQIAALKSRQEASQVVIRLQAAGYAVRLVEPEGEGRRYFRVWVGEFPTLEAAQKLEQRLKKDNFPTYVRKVRR